MNVTIDVVILVIIRTHATMTCMLINMVNYCYCLSMVVLGTILITMVAIVLTIIVNYYGNSSRIDERDY